jgi:predicted nucleotidyltransferase
MHNMHATPVSTKPDLIALIQSKRAALVAAGVRQMGVFGSFARGHQRPESDVDLLVVFEPDRKTFDNFMSVLFLMQDLLQRPVELVTPESLSPYIGPDILKEVEYVPLMDELPAAHSG